MVGKRKPRHPVIKMRGAKITAAIAGLLKPTEKVQKDAA